MSMFGVLSMFCFENNLTCFIYTQSQADGTCLSIGHSWVCLVSGYSGILLLLVRMIIITASIDHSPQSIDVLCTVCFWVIVSLLIHSPFYGEDFFFEIPRPFQYLSFYIYAKGSFQRDLPVGMSLTHTLACTHTCTCI